MRESEVIAEVSVQIKVPKGATTKVVDPAKGEERRSSTEHKWDRAKGQLTWKGVVYTFETNAQIAFVHALWVAWYDGTRDVPEKFLLDSSGLSEGHSPARVFRGKAGLHSAFNTVIVSSQLEGGPLCCYRLSDA